MNGYIYLTTNLITEKKYIGQSLVDRCKTIRGNEEKKKRIIKGKKKTAIY